MQKATCNNLHVLRSLKNNRKYTWVSPLKQLIISPIILKMQEEEITVYEKLQISIKASKRSVNTLQLVRKNMCCPSTMMTPEW